MNPYVRASPQAKHLYNPTNAASLRSWLLRKVVLALRRSAGRISPSWRRRLKPLTSSGRRRNAQQLPGRMTNLRNLCECFPLFLASPPSSKLTRFPPSFSAPSLRLAYKDLEQHRKIEEQKLKGLDGKKKEQAERLGMGIGVRRYDVEEEAAQKRVQEVLLTFLLIFIGVVAAACLTL